MRRVLAPAVFREVAAGGWKKDTYEATQWLLEYGGEVLRHVKYVRFSIPPSERN
jgi:hypothetical protein